MPDHPQTGSLQNLCNGTWSMEELQATYPNLSEETFAAMDTSADGQIDAAEYEAAMGANLLTQ